MVIKLKSKVKHKTSWIENKSNFKMFVFFLTLMLLGLFITTLGLISKQNIINLFFILVMLLFTIIWIIYNITRPVNFGISKTFLYLRHRNKIKKIPWKNIEKVNYQSKNFDRKIPFWATIILKNGKWFDIGFINGTIAKNIQYNLKKYKNGANQRMKKTGKD